MMTIEERKHGNTITIYKTHLSPELNSGKITIERARKIEIALNLPKFQLVSMINPSLTEKQIESLENIYKSH